jgi:muramidase (phage lysozyme)
VARSPIFDNVDPGLLQLLQQVGGSYGPNKVNITSAYRPGDPRFHGQGKALDVQLSDPSTGAALANYQDASTAQAYQAFANTVYQQAMKENPELAEKLRWGGYFSGGAGKYGALDLMHFDVGGGAGGMGMAGGSWQGGWTPEMMDTWGLKSPGGAGGGGAGGWAPEQIQKAFLDTIAQGESPGYDVMYGGQKFSDFSRHPHSAQTANGVSSDAAGRYQFLGSTWDELQKKYGYKDFSQANQDAAAWQYAGDIYKTKTGGSLEEALSSGDPARVNAAAQVLNQTWTSLPGGKEQSKGFGDKTFYDIYKGYLGGGSGGATPTSIPGYSSGGAAPGSAAATPAAAQPKKQNMWDIAGDALAGIGSAPAPKYSAQAPQAVAPARADAEAVAPVASPGGDRRQLLAEAMARLNSGRLF